MPLLFDYLIPIIDVPPSDGWMDWQVSIVVQIPILGQKLSTKTIHFPSEFNQTQPHEGWVTYRLLCWLDSCRGYASCWVVKSLFPCPNRTRDWPCRNWLEGPCLCLRPILPDRFLFLFYRTLLPKRLRREDLQSPLQRDGTNKKKKKTPPNRYCLNISVSRSVPLGLLKCVWVSLPVCLHDSVPSVEPFLCMDPRCFSVQISNRSFFSVLDSCGKDPI